MNLIPTAPLWLVILLGCAMIAAAVEDALRFRISNLTSLVVLAGAVAAAVIEGPSAALWQNGVVFAVLLLLGTAAFAARWLGGGDVKLFAVVGLWFDLHAAVWLVALVFLAGGLVAIAYLMSRPFRRGASGKIRNGRVPYGIAIAVGTLLMVLAGRGVFTHHPQPLPQFRINPPRG